MLELFCSAHNTPFRDSLFYYMLKMLQLSTLEDCTE